LTTDFGTTDPFVGIMKGVILGIAPEVQLVDLTHAVPPQDVVAGAYLLAAAASYFPAGTIHVAVVDPGVGTRRRALVVETRRGFFVAPDNGLLTLAAPPGEVTRILDASRSRYRRRPVSRTFHGRDVFAPLAGQLAAGVAPERLGSLARRMLRLALRRPRRTRGRLAGEVLWIDRFGNLITNVTRDDLARAGFRGRGVSVRIGGHVLRLLQTYAGVAAGKPLALVNSASHLEIALRDGSAAAVLGVGRGAQVLVGGR
jgi:S-adenosyl-L-methionine hydrolase (adenosine-forming)